MESAAVYELPFHRRHLAVDERGVGLRATWHADRGFVNVSLWTDARCAQTFHLTPVEAARLIGYLASVLAEGVGEPGCRSSSPARPAPPASGQHDAVGNSLSDRLLALRGDVADALERASRRVRPTDGRRPRPSGGHVAGA